MPLPRRIRIVGLVVIAGAVGAGGYRVWRGPTGASTDYGGSLAAQTVPDFPSTDPARWVNGAPAPLSGLRGEVVVLEAWGPA